MFSYVFGLLSHSAEKSSQFPVLAFSSGPTNSMRGAAHLSRNQDAIVVDIGGTTTDVGVLVNGFPRPASTRVNCGGVTTNFRMPDVLSIALGGGSIVSNEGIEVFMYIRIGSIYFYKALH